MHRLRRVAGAVTAVTGFEKGSGKTTLLGLLLRHARHHGPAAAFTIGVDGVGHGGTPIHVEPGDVVLTTEPMARASEARFEVLDTVPGRASLGRLLLGRARRAGAVTLVGSEHFSALSDAVLRVRREGWAHSVLIDGSVNRLTQVSALGDLQFTFAVRVTRANLRRAAEKVKALAELADLPRDEGEGAFRVEGPLTPEMLETLPPETQAISLPDFTKVFLDAPTLHRTLDRYRVTVRRSFGLLGFAVGLRDVRPEEFLFAVGPKAGEQVLFNPFGAS